MIIMDYYKLTCRFCAVGVALLGLVLFAGCKMLSSSDPDFPDMPVKTAAAGGADATPTINNNGAEFIHVGDSLTVVFSDLPTTPPQLQVQVDENGKITDRKSTRLNSSHEWISYAVFCLKKKSNRNMSIAALGSRVQTFPILSADTSKIWRRFFVSCLIPL